jgi:hypothetical protein
MFAKVIRRMEILGPERERRCLEKFLLALTEIVRLLFIRNPDSSMRMQILIQANEINHRVLNRVMALQGGEIHFSQLSTPGTLWKSTSTQPQ